MRLPNGYLFILKYHIEMMLVPCLAIMETSTTLLLSQVTGVLYISNRRGLVGGDKGTLKIKKRVRARMMAGRRGQRGLSGREDSRRTGTVGKRTYTGKHFPVVGDVRSYRGAYWGGAGVQTGDGETGQVCHVQHL